MDDMLKRCLEDSPSTGLTTTEYERGDCLLKVIAGSGYDTLYVVSHKNTLLAPTCILTEKLDDKDTLLCYMNFSMIFVNLEDIERVKEIMTELKTFILDCGTLLGKRVLEKSIG